MGPSVNNGEPAMDTNEWRTRLPYDSRQKMVKKIMDTLMKHHPCSGPEGINEARKIAARFEDKIFSSAVNQSDYLQKIYLKMLPTVTKAQDAAGSASSIPADSSNSALDERDNRMLNNGNVEPFLLNEDPDINNSGDWRTQLPPGSRQRIVNKILDTLMNHLSFSGPEDEFKKIATRFEEKFFSHAVNQTDYLRNISLKMLTMVHVSASVSNSLAVDELYKLMNNGNAEPSLPNEEPAIN